MTKVFVTHENANLDYSPAEAWGELCFITHKDFTSMGELSPHNADLIREIRAKVATFNADTDLIVISGSPLVAAAMFMLLAKRGISRVNILRWSNRDHNYNRTSINIEV